MAKISVIIPCYYNEKNIPITAQKLLENELLFEKDVEFEYIMIDDGSKDNTYNELLKFKQQYPNKIKIIKLSGNFGSYNAIIAGMDYAEGDCNVVLSCDLQDPPALILTMYNHWKKGIKLVLANREKRDDGIWSNLFSNFYQKMIKKYGIPTLPDGGFDFCLFDKEVKNEILKLKEQNTNALYLMVWMRYEYVNIPYQRQKREIGTSKWTFSKKLKLFVDTFVSFSFTPIRLITVMGIFIGIAAIIYAAIIIYERLVGNIDAEGWTTLMVVLLLVSSFQIIALGILGEYIWRVLDAARNRPLYIVDKTEL
jgi:glycosyltransferase involved in cell wall biosynthesis